MHKHPRLPRSPAVCVCVSVCVRKHALACLKCHVALVLVFQLDPACSFSSLQVMFRGVPEPLAGCVITVDCLTNSQITGRPHRKHRERESLLYILLLLSFKSPCAWVLAVYRVQRLLDETAQGKTHNCLHERGITWCFGDGDGFLGQSPLSFTYKEEIIYQVEWVRGPPLFKASSFNIPYEW